MSHVDAPYAQGTPCWVDLMSPDQQAAIDFYSDLFGWAAEIGPAETGGYAICTLNGRPVAGIGAAMAMGDQPPPPTVWTTYLAADDADDVAAKIAAAGGQVVVPAMDVTDVGRMLIAVDPTGAVFGVWEPKGFFGAQIVNEPGALSWNELNTRDSAAASAFYTAALGISVEAMGEMPGYSGLHAAGRLVGGLQTMTDELFPAEIPPHWMTYFAVDDCDSTVDAHVKAGGTVMAAPFDFPFGRMAVLADPQTAVFSVIQLNSEGGGS
jgi:hypothetical protein